MNAKLLALGFALALVATLAIPTVAFSGGGEDDLGPLALEPHHGPNGEYATVVDDQIELEFDRLSERSTTTVDDVFSMAATADEPVEVWIEFDEVEVYVDGDPNARIDAEADAVTLQPGESVDVGVRIEADDETPDTDRMTIHASGTDEDSTPTPTPTATPDPTPSPGEAQFEVVEVTTAEEVTAGVPTTINVTVENVGDVDGEYTAEFVVDGVVVDTRTVWIPAGEQRTVSFERTFEESGTFDVGSGDVHGQVDVGSPDAEGEAIIEVTDVRIDPTAIDVGESTEIVATVENVGDADGTDDVELAVGGLVVDSKEVEVPAGETREVEFDRQFTEAGVYAISVGGVEGGDVVVGQDERELVASIQATALPFLLAALLVLLVLRRKYGIRPFTEP